MAQLVVQKTPWWKKSVKGAVFWAPLAAMQATAVIGGGYFYYRLTELEKEPLPLPSPSKAKESKAAVAVDPPVVKQVVVSERKAAMLSQADRPALVTSKPLKIVADVENSFSSRVGVDFSSLPQVAALGSHLEPVTVHSDAAPAILGSAIQDQAKKSAEVPVHEPISLPEPAKKVEKQAKQVVEAEVKTPENPREPVEVSRETEKSFEEELLVPEFEDELTAVANRQGMDESLLQESLELESQEEEVVVPDNFASAIHFVTEEELAGLLAQEESPAVNDDFTGLPDYDVSDGKPLPVGTVVWVYLGELRDYGWHGPRLHVPVDSGLPEVGKRYRTQELHGLYDQPHGNRIMGGFQQGDVVTILKVRYDSSKAVWAKVSKTQAVGRLNR